MQYTEGQIGRVFVVRIDDGEDMLLALRQFILDRNIQAGSIHFLGALMNGRMVTGPEEPGHVRRRVGDIWSRHHLPRGGRPAYPLSCIGWPVRPCPHRLPPGKSHGNSMRRCSCTCRSSVRTRLLKLSRRTGKHPMKRSKKARALRTMRNPMKYPGVLQI